MVLLGTDRMQSPENSWVAVDNENSLDVIRVLLEICALRTRGRLGPYQGRSKNKREEDDMSHQKLLAKGRLSG